LEKKEKLESELQSTQQKLKNIQQNYQPALKKYQVQFSFFNFFIFLFKKKTK